MMISDFSPNIRQTSSANPIARENIYKWHNGQDNLEYRSELEKGKIPLKLIQDLRIIDPELQVAHNFDQAVTAVIDKFIPSAELDYANSKPKYLLADTNMPFTLSVTGSVPPLIVISKGMFSEVEIPTECREKEFGLIGVSIPPGKNRLIDNEIDLATFVIKEIARSNKKDIFRLNGQRAMTESFLYIPVIDLLTRRNHNPYYALLASIKYDLTINEYRSNLAESGFYSMYPTQSLLEPFIREFIGGFSSVRGGINKDSVPKKFDDNHPLIACIGSEVIYESEFSKFLKDNKYEKVKSADEKIKLICTALTQMDFISDSAAKDIEATLKKLPEITEKKADVLLNTFFEKIPYTSTENSLIIYQAISSKIKNVRRNSLLGRLKKLDEAAAAVTYPSNNLTSNLKQFVLAVEREPLAGIIIGRNFLQNLSWSISSGFSKLNLDSIPKKLQWSHIREAVKAGDLYALKAAYYLGIGEDTLFTSMLPKNPELALEIYGNMYRHEIKTQIGRASTMKYPAVLPSPFDEEFAHGAVIYDNEKDTAYLTKHSDSNTHNSILINDLRKLVAQKDLDPEIHSAIVSAFKRLYPKFDGIGSTTVILNENSTPADLPLIALTDNSSSIWSNRSNIAQHKKLYDLLSQAIKAETIHFDSKDLIRRMIGISSTNGKPICRWTGFNSGADISTTKPEDNAIIKLVIDNPNNFLTEAERIAFFDHLYTRHSSNRELKIQTIKESFKKFNIPYLIPLKTPKDCIKACQEFIKKPSAALGKILADNITEAKVEHTIESTLALLQFYESAKAIGTIDSRYTFEAFLPNDFSRVKFKLTKFNSYLNKLPLNQAIKVFAIFSTSGIINQETIDNIGNKITSRLETEKDHDLLWKSSLIFFKTFAGVEPERRKKIIEKCAKTRLLIHGIANQTPEYQQTLLKDFNDDFTKLPMSLKVQFAREVALSVEAQNNLANTLRDLCFKSVNLTDFPETLSFLFEEKTFLSLPYDYQKRKALIDFLRFPYSEDRAKEMLISFFELKQKQVDFTKSLHEQKGTLDLNTRKLYEHASTVQDMVTGELEFTAGQLKITKEDVLQAFYSNDTTNPDTLNAVQVMFSFSERLYNEFHALGIEKKAMICRRLIYPSIRSTQEVTIEGIQYLTRQIVNPKSPAFELFNRTLTKYLNSKLPDQRGLICTALLLSSKGVDAAQTQEEVGKAIARLVQLLGPIERRLAQFGANLDLVPAYIRIPFQEIKSDADKPEIWDHSNWVEQIKPDLTTKLSRHFKDETLKVKHSCPVMGSASMGVANRLILSNNEKVILYLLRPFTVQVADQGLDNMEATLPELDNEAMRTVLYEVLVGLRGSLPLETNMLASQAQYDEAAKIYKNKFIVVDGTTIDLDNANVLASGHIKGTDGIEYRYYCMTEVEGQHLDTFHDENSDIGKNVLMGLLVIEFINILNGIGDDDRQERNIKAKRNGKNVKAGHFDLKATRLQKASDHGIRQLAETFISSLPEIVSGVKELPVVFMENQQKLREKYEGKIDPYIPAVHRRLLALLGSLKRLNPKQQFRVIASAISEAPQIFKDQIANHAESSIPINILRDLAAGRENSMLNIALGTNWKISIQSKT